MNLGVVLGHALGGTEEGIPNFGTTGEVRGKKEMVLSVTKYECELPKICREGGCSRSHLTMDVLVLTLYRGSFFQLI